MATARYMLEKCKKECTLRDVLETLDAIPAGPGKCGIEKAIAECGVSILGASGWIELLYRPLEESEMIRRECQEEKAAELDPRSVFGCNVGGRLVV